ncbi:Uncharacterised protein [Mycobacteroides abscessus subsp. abscessus]|nr:Uncharacterised protein [Mycobacteroides abscessus subsp. abscessus]
MARPDRVVVGDAFGVVPHAVTVDQVSPGGHRNPQHAAINVGGYARQQL